MFDHLASFGIRRFKFGKVKFDLLYNHFNSDCLPPGSEHPRDCCGEPVTGDFEWSGLPDTLRFLVLPAFTYGGLQFESDRKRFWRSMTPTQRDELAKLALSVDGETRKQIDSWMCGRNGDQNTRISWLMNLLDEFSRKSRLKNPSEDGLDWSKVPKRPSYLVMHAKECAKCIMEADRVRFMSELGYGLLKLRGEQLNATKDRKLLEKWLQDFPPARNPEVLQMLSFVKYLDDYFPLVSFDVYGSS